MSKIRPATGRMGLKTSESMRQGRSQPRHSEVESPGTDQQSGLHSLSDKRNTWNDLSGECELFPRRCGPPDEAELSRTALVEDQPIFTQQCSRGDWGGADWQMHCYESYVRIRVIGELESLSSLEDGEMEELCTDQKPAENSRGDSGGRRQALYLLLEIFYGAECRAGAVVFVPMLEILCGRQLPLT